MRHAGFFFVFLAGTLWADIPANITVVPGSETPLIQLSGSVIQMSDNGIYTTTITAINFVSSVGVAGLDEGASVLFPDGRTFTAFGDTVFTYPHASLGTPVFYGSFPAVVYDSMMLLPSNDWSKCSAISNLDSQLQQGISNLVPNYTGCATPTFIQNIGHSSSQPIASSITVTGLAGGEDLLGSHTPTGVFVDTSGYIYLHYNVKTQAPTYRIDSILAKSNIPYSAINSTTVPVFHKVYSHSLAPTIPTGQVSVTLNSPNVGWVSGTTFDSSWSNGSLWQDIDIGDSGIHTYTVQSVTDNHNLVLSSNYTGANDASITYNMVPLYDINHGKFMFGGFTTATSTQAYQRGWTPMLPPALSTAAFIVCYNGTSFGYRQSNIYLSCVDGAQIDVSSTAWWYVTGFNKDAPTWTQNDELDAVPLLSSWTHAGNRPQAPCIGEMDIKWVDPLNSLVLTYGNHYNCGGMWVRTAKYPWGPFSYEQQFFDNNANSGWNSILIHAAGSSNSITANTPPVYQSDGTTPCDFVSNGFSLGGNYGGYQIGKWTDNGDGTVTIYHYFSAFAPYVAWLGSFKLNKGTQIYPTGTVTLKGTATLL